MNLSAKLFEDITGLDPAGLESVPGDRRAQPRAPLLSRATVYPVYTGVGSTFVVEVRDVSVMGVGFISPHRMTAGREFMLQLPRRGGEPLILICAAVRCVSRRQDGSYFVGATFEGLVEALESSIPAGSQLESGQHFSFGVS